MYQIETFIPRKNCPFHDIVNQLIVWCVFFMQQFRDEPTIMSIIMFSNFFFTVHQNQLSAPKIQSIMRNIRHFSCHVHLCCYSSMCRECEKNLHNLLPIALHFVFEPNPLFWMDVYFGIALTFCSMGLVKPENACKASYTFTTRYPIKRFLLEFQCKVMSRIKYYIINDRHRMIHASLSAQ